MAFGGSSAAELALRVTSDARDAAAGLDATTEKASRMGKIGNAAGKLLAVGLLAAGAAAIKMTQAAAEDAAGAATLANTLKQVAGESTAGVAATESWIAAQGRAFGVADDELRPALGALVTATKDVGKAQDLASLAMDISAKSGKSLQSVSEALAKAYTTGNVAALAKYKVATKDAAGEARSLGDVTKDLSSLYAGSASTAAETAAGKQKRLQVAMGELQEEIGYKLLPVLLTLSTYGLKVVDWIDRNQVAVGIFLGSLASLLAVVFAVSKAIQAWKAITQAYTAVQWLLNAAMTANPIALVVIAVVALVAAIVLAYKHSETFRRIVDGAFRAVQTAASFAFNWVKSHWPLLLVVLLGPFGLALVGIIKNRDRIIDAVKGVITWVKGHWEVLLTILLGPFGLALVGIIKNRDRIIDAVKGAIEWVRGHWDAIEALLTAPFRLGAATIVEQKNRIVSAAKAMKSGFVTALDAMTSPVRTLIDLVQNLIDKIASIKPPKIDIPGVDIGNPFNRSIAGSGTTTAPVAPPVTNNYYIDQTGLLSLDQGAEKLLTTLRQNARRTGGQVVVLG